MKNTTKTDIQKKLNSGQITPEEIADRANSFLKKNELENAYPYISVMSNMETATAETSNIAGLTALLLAKKNIASKHFKKSLKKDPENFDANYNLSLIEIDDGYFKKAITRLKKLLKLNPENSELYNDLAVVSAMVDDFNKAFKYWSRALEINPNSSKARNNAMVSVIEKGMLKEGNHLLELNTMATNVSKQAMLEIEHWQKILNDKIKTQQV